MKIITRYHYISYRMTHTIFALTLSRRMIAIAAIRQMAWTADECYSNDFPYRLARQPSREVNHKLVPPWKLSLTTSIIELPFWKFSDINWHRNLGELISKKFKNLNRMLLISAVRTGNLAKFNEALSTHGDKFQAEHTYTLIIRLRHNVIKTGVRMIR